MRWSSHSATEKVRTSNQERLGWSVLVESLKGCANSLLSALGNKENQLHNSQARQISQICALKTCDIRLPYVATLQAFVPILFYFLININNEFLDLTIIFCNIR